MTLHSKCLPTLWTDPETYCLLPASLRNINVEQRWIDVMTYADNVNKENNYWIFISTGRIISKTKRRYSIGWNLTWSRSGCETLETKAAFPLKEKFPVCAYTVMKCRPTFLYSACAYWKYFLSAENFLEWKRDITLGFQWMGQSDTNKKRRLFPFMEPLLLIVNNTIDKKHLKEIGEKKKKKTFQRPKVTHYITFGQWNVFFLLRPQKIHPGFQTSDFGISKSQPQGWEKRWKKLGGKNRADKIKTCHSLKSTLCNTLLALITPAIMGVNFGLLA